MNEPHPLLLHIKASLCAHSALINSALPLREENWGNNLLCQCLTYRRVRQNKGTIMALSIGSVWNVTGLWPTSADLSCSLYTRQMLIQLCYFNWRLIIMQFRHDDAADLYIRKCSSILTSLNCNWIPMVQTYLLGYCFCPSQTLTLSPYTVSCPLNLNDLSCKIADYIIMGLLTTYRTQLVATFLIAELAKLFGPSKYSIMWYILTNQSQWLK